MVWLILYIYTHYAFAYSTEVHSHFKPNREFNLYIEDEHTHFNIRDFSSCKYSENEYEEFQLVRIDEDLKKTK